MSGTDAAESALAQAFKALGDPVRLRLFHLLAGHDELCVCHLTAALALPQSTVSRHLGVLRQAGLVRARRAGKWMHYRLHGELAARLAAVVAEHGEAAVFDEDAGRLVRATQG